MFGLFDLGILLAIIIITIIIMMYRRSEHYYICKNCQGWVLYGAKPLPAGTKTRREITAPALKNPFTLPYSAVSSPLYYNSTIQDTLKNNAFVGQSGVNDANTAETIIPQNSS